MYLTVWLNKVHFLHLIYEHTFQLTEIIGNFLVRGTNSILSNAFNTYYDYYTIGQPIHQL